MAKLAAPAFGAAMSAATLSFMPEVSAAGGFDIPAGLSPVTQIHPREMVLPAEYADVILGMCGAGGGGNITINAVDRRGLEAVLKSNRRAIERFAVKAVRTRGRHEGLKSDYLGTSAPVGKSVVSA